MENKTTLLISTGSRSEEYVKPILRRLENHRSFDVVLFTCLGLSFRASYELACESVPVADYVIIPSDRKEHLPVVIAASEHKIPIIQLYAGDISSGTEDDLNRYVYSIYADVICCASMEAFNRVATLFEWLGKDASKIYLTGATHLDDIDIDESAVPETDYDLILYNPITRGDGTIDRMMRELWYIREMLNTDTIWLEPCEDEGRELIIDFASAHQCPAVLYWNRVPRSIFFGLLKNTKRFITNSSSACYEAAEFLEDEQIVQIGERNRVRERVENRRGGTDRIMQVLEKECIPHD